MKMTNKTTIIVVLIMLFQKVGRVQSCFWQKAPETKIAGSFSTPAPPPPVVSDCGHNKYYHNVNEPGIGIVNGQNIEPNQYPWIARLSISVNSGVALCGSTIINNLWLLTAAHCVEDAKASGIKAIFADYDRSALDDGEYTRTVANITVHPRYNSKTQDYDFALLKLSDYITFLDWKTQKICLPKTCSDGCAAGTYAYIAGWGIVSERGNVPPRIMQTGLVKIVDSGECGYAYSKNGDQITDTMTCANFAGTDSCSGDSGGPMMVVEDGFYKLCGVTSFGNGCGRAGYPGVYSRVCTIVDWIKTNAVM